jgi:putative transposase
VAQAALARLDKTYQAFFRRLQRGEKAGFPRFKPATRYTSFTYKEYGNGATLDNGFLVLSKIGRIAMRWSRPIEGAPKTVTISREADGWYVCLSWADVPTQPLPAIGQETGIDLGIEAFATLSDGTRIFHPGWYRKAERALKTAQRRVTRGKRGSNRRRKAVTLLAKAHQTVRRQRADFHHKMALALVRENHYRRGVGRVPHHPDGQGSMRRSQDRSPLIPHLPRSDVAAVGRWSRRAYPSAGIRVRSVARACIGTTTRPRT